MAGDTGCTCYSLLCCWCAKCSFDVTSRAGGGADARGSRGRKKKAKKKDYASQLSLKKAVQANLGLGLDKTCQRSNWDRRPLTREQLQYAAADAAVLLDLHSKWLLCC